MKPLAPQTTRTALAVLVLAFGACATDSASRQGTGGADTQGGNASSDSIASETATSAVATSPTNAPSTLGESDANSGGAAGAAVVDEVAGSGGVAGEGPAVAIGGPQSAGTGGTSDDVAEMTVSGDAGARGVGGMGVGGMGVGGMGVGGMGSGGANPAISSGCSACTSEEQCVACFDSSDAPFMCIEDSGGSIEAECGGGEFFIRQCETATDCEVGQVCLWVLGFGYFYMQCGLRDCSSTCSCDPQLRQVCDTLDDCPECADVCDSVSEMDDPVGVKTCKRSQ